MSANIRILLTARPHVDDEIMECFCKVVRTPCSPARDGGEGYLGMGLDRLGDTDHYAMEYMLLVHTMRMIVEKIWKVRAIFNRNIFLIKVWVVIQG